MLGMVPDDPLPFPRPTPANPDRRRFVSRGVTTPRVARVAALAVLVAGLLTGCGDDRPDDFIRVVSPTPDAVVRLPFEVTLEASVPLGPPGVEDHHAHIWFGDAQDAFLVVESETVLVSNAPLGEQEMHVSLHYADHTPVGPEATIRLTVSDVPNAAPEEARYDS